MEITPKRLKALSLALQYAHLSAVADNDEVLPQLRDRLRTELSREGITSHELGLLNYDIDTRIEAIGEMQTL